MKKIFGLFLAMIMMTSFLGGCVPKKEVKIVDLKEVHAAVKEALGEDYYANRELTVEEIKDLTGIKEEDIEVFIAEVPMISVNVDTFIAIKAKEGKGAVIEDSLEKHRKFLVEESLQYPMNMPKVNSAKVVRHGDYVFFLMLGKYDDRQEATEEERLEFAKAEVKKVEDIINKFFE
ncbi:DUF4358 domain-containing protein [Tissierella carlieri]|jgi:soluble cytochrome b562|uniref:DUF4358 domain-containing protein n=1 Tax=Tissierella carlieri TaxID=689904 RepID=UPI001C11C9FC|nr:DUF4358 domain-containing protein [Tissierella carlieri]MBU5314084.1 DUF4358 domain-containing protein [Tissierella carlieri]